MNKKCRNERDENNGGKKNCFFFYFSLRMEQ